MPEKKNHIYFEEDASFWYYFKDLFSVCSWFVVSKCFGH